MGKLFILGIILAIVIGIALMPYLKWILLFLAVKMVLELIIKFKATRTPKQKPNPLAFMQMGMSNIGNRIEQGFDTPKVKLSKVLVYTLGIIALIAVAKFSINFLINLFYRFKYLLLLLLILVVLLLLRRAKQGKPITIRKMARRASNIRTKRNSDSSYDEHYNPYDEHYHPYDEHYSQYDNEQEYSYNVGYHYDKRHSYDRNMRREEYDYDASDDVCMHCRHRRNCDEDKRRKCPEIRPRRSRSKRMDYI